MIFKDILEKLSRHEHLSNKVAEFALSEIITGQCNHAQTAAFLFGMRSKGETVDELASFVRVMRNASLKVNASHENAIDLCGTGGDGTGTFNISTATMFVAAGAGVPVLKHGNRSISSKSGSYDVLEELGVKPDLPKEAVETCFAETGMAFMFAPLFHPAMKYVMPARKELGMRTFFNILGPLLNPAGVKRQVIGAYNKDVAALMMRILSQLDTEFAYGVHAADGMDEFTTTTTTHVFTLQYGKVSSGSTFDPRMFSLEIQPSEALLGGDAKFNAEIIRNILQNKASRAQKEIVLLNATFALKASGLFDDIEVAHQKAKESIDSGAAFDKLQQFASVTQKLAQ